MNAIKLGCDQIFWGEGAINELTRLTGTFRKAFIVMSGDILRKTGGFKVITNLLEQAHIQWEDFSEVEPEPSFETVMRGKEAMKVFEPDLVIGFGGGSAMDAAKAMWVFYENEQYTKLTEAAAPNIIKNLGLKAKLACIPTSAGTGSEATRAALIKDPTQKQKYSIRDLNGRLVPTYAYLDPVFTGSMPKALIAGSGMDAITHSIEAYVTPQHNPFSDGMAMSAFKYAFQNIRQAYNNPEDTLARTNMLAASCMAGIAFSNCALGINHSVAHSFGAEFNIPHGMANAVVLPYAIAFNQKDPQTRAKYDELASLVGELDLLEAIHKLRKDLDIPTSFSQLLPADFDISVHIDRLTEKAMADVCTLFTPLKPDIDQMRALVRSACLGK
jgi:alcohol dehydrogenase class IV